ncbi:MAG: ATP-dependent RNA helicase HrpA [Actinomycetes bacterium]
MDTPPAGPAPADLTRRLPGLTLADQRRLRRRLDRARGVKDARRRRVVLDEIATEVSAAEERVAVRRANVPTLTYPEDLPISRRRDDIAAAIRDHQVVVVAGETGSGKTTQLPKICLELGRGVQGLIGHTQPRRIAARSVADRIAEELDVPLGDAVGYTVRFTDRVGESTLVRLMTDGILLAEIQRDPMLRRYDTLIIDEAHERSLTIDFLLGYLTQLLPRRPDLKVVITSATIDPDRFSRHFGGAPVVEVSGRTYPVDVRYRPLVDETGGEDEDELDDARRADRDQTQGILDAVDELCAEGPGDILVFLSGEREIRDTADALSGYTEGAGRPVEVLPLYARLSAAEQHRVFAPHPGRRVVLATNVAETSLTVPGIRYVVDPGTARLSRYSHRLKVQRLPIEAISRASASQRAGRCGRVADGVCIRLYSADDLAARPEFTDPEILRTNLASVILQMTALGLGDMDAFPFVEPPDRRQVRDGVQLLEELGALDPAQADPAKRLTPLGRRLAQLPVDPRLGRMVLEAETQGCVREVLVIAAALSIQDLRERPAENREAADEKHRRFADETSDFLAYLNLWDYLREQQEALSGNAFRRLCRREYLHYLRVREWQDLVGQLRRVAKRLGVALPRPDGAGATDPDRVHAALLAGLLSHVGVRDPDKRDYLGARGARFAIWPGSALARKPPALVMAGELVETSRLWARDVARIQPEWAERVGAHLVKRSYSEPHWSKKRAAVMAYQRVTLYGVPLAANRRVAYGAVDPVVSRDLFLRHALVEGDWDTHHRFFHENRALLGEVEELEHRARRRDILVDDDTLYDFYDHRVPEDVVSGPHFDAWWKKARRETPDLLDFTRAELVNAGADEVSETDYPDVWHHGDLALRLTYQFEPGTDADGVTVHVPLAVLNQVDPQAFAWQVPGLREELVTALIRSLPKALRRGFVPAPDHARAALARMAPGDGPLLDALAGALRSLTGVVVPHDAWDLARLPDHLSVTFRVEDDDGGTVAEGKDVEDLVRRLRPRVRTRLAQAMPSVERAGLTGWQIGALPTRVEQPSGDGPPVAGFPALVDEGDSVGVHVLGNEAEQAQAMWAGTRRLLLLSVPSPAKALLGGLGNETKLALSRAPHGSASALFDDCLACAVDALMAGHGGPAWDEVSFDRLRDAVRGALHDRTAGVLTQVGRILGVTHEIELRVRSMAGPALAASLDDVSEQTAGLVHPGFVAATGERRLPDVLRYLRGVSRRLDVLPDNPARDLQRTRVVAEVAEEYCDWLDTLSPTRRATDEVKAVRWMIEELRVSLFAQRLGTAHPVSEKRIRAAMDAATP